MLAKPIYFAKVAVLVGLFLPFLAGCSEEKTPKEEFLGQIISDIDDGVSYRRIALKIKFWQYPGQENPNTKFEESRYEYEMDQLDETDSEEEYNLQSQKLVTAIRDNNCSAIQSNLEFIDYLDTSTITSALTAILSIDGICTNKNTAKAATLLTNNLADNISDAESAARLGDLYYRGEGVEKNINLAAEWFKKAVVWQYASIYNAARLTTKEQDQITLEYKTWQKAPDELKAIFANLYTGPWDLPPPLVQEIDRVVSIKKGDVNGIIELATQIFNGTDGYETDPGLAIQWLFYAQHDRFPDDQEVQYLEALWYSHDSYCRQMLEYLPDSDCSDDRKYALSIMESLVGEDHIKAIRYVAKAYRKLSQQIWTDWNVYHLYLVTQNRYPAIEAELSLSQSTNLSDAEKGVINAWYKAGHTFPIGQALPGSNGEK